MTPAARFFPRALLGALGVGRTEAVSVPLEGACLFADVSGFTAMSEALLAMGKEGSEVLTKVLNGFYARVVGEVHAHGGDVMRFAGDAVTAHFPDARRAVRAALAMQALMPDFAAIATPAGTFTLKMKAGVASGTALLFTVGDARQMDYVYSGDPVDGSAEAEHHAVAGEVVVKADELRVHDLGCEVENMPEGFWRVAAPGASEGAPPPAAGPLVPLPEAHGSFLHPMLWEALSAGQAGLLNEHRHITVLFASFRSMQSEADATEGIRAFYLRAAEAARGMDGYINKVDMGDKGSKLLVLFGAPRAHEDDETRALLCAQGLLAAARETGFSIRMGLNAAKVFCGLVGSEERCEYTVMGDGVNVAARLMQAAPEGGCLASPSVKARSGGRFAFRDLPPLTLKGKKEPFPVALLVGRKGEEDELPNFIGREKEAEALDRALAQQPADQAGLYILHGEAGVGKTAFLARFLRDRLHDHRVLKHRCASHALSIPYAAFRDLLPAILRGEEPAEAAHALIARRDPEVLEYLPILLNTFGLAGTPVEEPALEPEVRRSLLWKMAGLIVDDATATQGGLAVAVDEGQWLDEESRALLTHLVRMAETGRLKVFLTQREAPAAEEGIHGAAVAVPPFSEPETAAFLRRALSVEEVPVEAVRTVFASGKGNPLLARETLGLLFQSGYLARDEEYPQILLVDESKSPDLPDSIGGLVLSRLDALPLAERAVLRTLAVAGERIPVGLAQGLGLDPVLLEGMAREGSFILEEGDGGGYRFVQTHAVPAIYESIEFAQRRELHGKIGRLLRECLSPDDPQTCHVLAHHFGRAGLQEAVPYLLESAAQARKAFAIAQAIQALEQALAIGTEQRVASDQIVLDLAQLLLLAGRAEDALKLLERNLEQISAAQRSGALRLLAEAYLSLGQVPRAEEILNAAVGSAADEREAFLSACLLGKIYGRSGRVQKAREIIQQTNQRFRAFSDHKESKLNQMRMAFIDYQMGETGQAIRTFLRLKRHFEQRGDIIAAFTIGNNLGHLFALAGQHRKAYKLFLGFYDLVKKFGIWESEIYLGLLDNLGNQLMDLGNWSKAEHYFLQDLAYSRRNDSAHAFKPLYLLGEVEIYKGNLRRSLDLLLESQEQCQRHGLPENEMFEQMANLALVLADRGLFEMAMRGYEKAMNKHGMVFLKAEYENCLAEGSLLFGDPGAFVEAQTRNLAACLDEEQYLDAFRCARFLLQATQEPEKLEAMERILAHCSKKQFHVAFRYLDYRFRPNSARRLLLARTIARFPYADLAWKAQVEMAKHDGSRRRNERIRSALDITRRMLDGLEPRYARSFQAQPNYRALIAMAEEADLPTA